MKVLAILLKPCCVAFINDCLNWGVWDHYCFWGCVIFVVCCTCFLCVMIWTYGNWVPGLVVISWSGQGSWRGPRMALALPVVLPFTMTSLGSKGRMVTGGMCMLACICHKSLKRSAHICWWADDIDGGWQCRRKSGRILESFFIMMIICLGTSIDFGFTSAAIVSWVGWLFSSQWMESKIFTACINKSFFCFIQYLIRVAFL